MKTIILILFSIINLTGCMSKQDKMNYPPQEYFQEKDVAVAEAIYDGNIQEIESLIKNKGYNVNTRGVGENRGSTCNYTYLSYAILLDNIKPVEKLLQLGADVNKTSLWGGGGISNIGQPCKRKNKAMIDLLLKYKVNLNPPLDESPLTPLLIGNADKSLLELLINNGANVNHQDYLDGGTACLTALGLGKFDYVHYFLDKGADPMLLDSSGNSIASAVQEEINEGRLSDYGLKEYTKLKERLINEFHVQYPVKNDVKKGRAMAIGRYENLSKDDKELLGVNELKRITKWKTELEKALEKSNP